MTRIATDILVAGGGIAGMTAALGMASMGHRVICIDPAPPEIPKPDLRSTAFFMPSVRLLQRIGLWDALADHATPLRIMRIADAGGEAYKIRELADFDATEIGQDAFGYNIANHRIRQVLLDSIAAHPNADLIAPDSVQTLLPRTHESLISLTSGAQISASLVIAADGRNSRVREALNIPIATWQFGQKALVFNVVTEIAHDNISTEIHRTGGPFTLVPLPDADGQNMCAIVWMATGPEIERLHKLEDDAFAQEVNLRSCQILGQLRPVGPRVVWPIIAQRAERLSGPRTVLIAEAAHVIPPIGAQGLNMSLSDLSTLMDLIEGAEDIGAPEITDRYHRRRWTEMAVRVQGVITLNRAAMAKSQTLRDLRVAALRSLYGIAPVRRRVMKAGMGV